MIETVYLGEGDIRNLAIASYFFLSDSLDPFTVPPKVVKEAFSKGPLSVDETKELVGRMVFDNIENLASLDHPDGHSPESRDTLIREAFLVVSRLTSDSETQGLLVDLPESFNSDEEAYRAFGSVIINEVLIVCIKQYVEKVSGETKPSY